VTCDLAISTKERADYSAFVIGGMDESGVLHVRHVIRERMDGEEIADTILALQTTYNPMAIGIEDTQISKSIGPFLNRMMMERNIFPTIVPLKPHRTDKISRARSIQARCRAAAVKVDKKAAWFPIFEDEVLTFPRARHDDIVDAFSYLGLMVDKMIESPTIQEIEEEQYEEELEESGWNENTRSQVTGY
jgi:predicted phage terminase large subunit-like protein